MSYYGFAPYVSVAEKRQRAARALAKLEKAGLQVEPLGEPSHRMKIATSFWGRSWCRHLENFSDYENRLPRGRTYVRNGSIMHLAVTRGEIVALVSGSELYRTAISIKPIEEDRWERIRSRCRGGIGSLIELLQGKISEQIMSVVANPEDGLFPKPGEIRFNCSCPDWAGLCKHSAAVLYGVGARLDQRPELLFILRGVDHNELMEATDSGAILGRGGRRKRIADSSIGDVFGVDFDSSLKEEPAVMKGPAAKAAKSKAVKPKAGTSKPAKPRKPAGKVSRKIAAPKPKKKPDRKPAIKKAAAGLRKPKRKS